MLIGVGNFAYPIKRKMLSIKRLNKWQTHE